MALITFILGFIMGSIGLEKIKEEVIRIFEIFKGK